MRRRGVGVTVGNVALALRTVVAAAFLVVGMIASERIRALARLTRVDAARVGFDMGGMEVGLLGLTLAVAWLLPARLSDTLGLARGRLPMGAVAALAIGALGLSHAVDCALTLTRTAQGSVIVSIAQAMQTASTTHWTLVVAFLGTVVAPAVCEELLCRGLVQRSVARTAGPFVAVCASAAFFGMLHMEWTHGLMAATIGLYLGFAAQRADSVRPAILAHGLNNLAALLSSQGALPIRAPLVMSAGIGLGLAVAGIVWASLVRPRGASSTLLQREADPAET